MRIGVNGRTFSVEEPRGSTLSSIELTRALAALPDTEVVVFGHSSIAQHFDHPDVDVTSIGFVAGGQLVGVGLEQAVLPRLVGRADVDILLCPNNDAPMRPCPVPTVLRVHDLFGYRGYGPLPYTILQQVRMPRMVDAADGLVATSEYVADELRLAFGPRPISVVPNGIDDLYLDDDPGDHVDLPEQYLLYVGALEPRKNADGLLKAFTILREEYDVDHELVLVGPRERFIDTAHSTIDLAELDGIHRLGFLEARQLKHVYTHADVFVFPSLAEGFGLPPLEALACGTPVVTTRRTAMPHVLGDAVRYAEATTPEAIAECVYAELTEDEGREQARADMLADIRWSNVAAQMRDVLERYSTSR